MMSGLLCVFVFFELCVIACLFVLLSFVLRVWFVCVFVCVWLVVCTFLGVCIVWVVFVCFDCVFARLPTCLVLC